MRTRDRFKYVFRPRPPTWRERFERGEGPLFWALSILSALGFWFALLFVWTL